LNPVQSSSVVCQEWGSACGGGLGPGASAVWGDVHGLRAGPREWQGAGDNKALAALGGRAEGRRVAFLGKHIRDSLFSGAACGVLAAQSCWAGWIRHLLRACHQTMHVDGGQVVPLNGPWELRGAPALFGLIA